MTRSSLVARLAERFPHLMARDTELAVRLILDAGETDAAGRCACVLTGSIRQGAQAVDGQHCVVVIAIKRKSLV